MSPWLIILNLSLVLVTLTGCATPGTVSTDIWHSLTPEQRTEAAVIERVITRLCEFAWLTESPGCRPPVVFLLNNGSVPHYTFEHNTIYIPRWALDPRARAIVAHELFHWYAGHNAQRCGKDPLSCEMEANWGGFIILRDAYATDANVAWLLMHQYLRAGLTSKPTKSHAPCRELNDFLRRSELPPDPCVAEVGR